MNKTEKYVKQKLHGELREVEASPRASENLGLTNYEKALIYKYSTDGYEDLNEQLRLSKGKNNSEFGKLLDKSIERLPNFEGLVYRGVTLTTLELQKYIDGLRNDDVILEYPFISTSKSRLIAMMFGHNCIFRIASKTGKDIEKIAKFGLHDPPNEKEVLFGANTKFKVLEVTNESSYTLITLEEV